jgi:hypothetical protein
MSLFALAMSLFALAMLLVALAGASTHVPSCMLPGAATTSRDDCPDSTIAAVE